MKTTGAFRSRPFLVGRFVIFSAKPNTGGGPYVVETAFPLRGGEFAHYLREADGKWRQFTQFKDKVIQAEFGPGDDLFVVSRADAPRGKMLRVPIAALHVSVVGPRAIWALIAAPSVSDVMTTGIVTAGVPAMLGVMNPGALL